MLGLFTYTDICHRLLDIADPETLALHGAYPKALRLALQARAQQFEPALPLWDTPSTVLVASERTEQLLRRLFAGPSKLDDLEQSTAIEAPFDAQERMSKLKQLREALDLLAELDPNLFEIFNTVVSCIFTSSSATAGGGTSSATPGVIWANLRNHWSVWDTLEFLIHELTHNLLFFDEFAALHYTDHNALERPKTFVQSAILMRQRPLDKVFHSIMVGLAILNLRANTVFQQVSCTVPLQLTTGIHPDSPTLVRQIRAAIDSIESNSEALRLLSPRGRELLQRADTRLNEFSQVCVSLTI